MRGTADLRAGLRYACKPSAEKDALAELHQSLNGAHYGRR